MATLGYSTTAQQNNVDQAGTDIIVASGTFTTGTTDLTVVSASVYVVNLAGSGARQQAMRVVLFPDSAGVPSTTVTVVSAEFIVSDLATLPTTQTVSAPATVLAASTSYWVATWWGTATNSAQIGVGLNNVSLGSLTSQAYNLSTTYSSASPPTVSGWTGAGNTTGNIHTYLAWFTLAGPQPPLHPSVPFMSNLRI